MKADGHVRLGDVGVDSGMVAFCDPAGMGLVDYDDVVQAIQNLPSARISNSYGIKVGVVAQTGLGDGSFPVTGFFRGGELQSVTVHFQLPEEAQN